jgi:hypothetical protein
MYNLVQFACLFCAGYSGLLITAALLTGDDPLAAFQFMAGHGPYIKYQFLVASAYCLFLMLLYVNVCVQRWLPNEHTTHRALHHGPSSEGCPTVLVL